MKLNKFFSKIKNTLNIAQRLEDETTLLAIGRMLSNQQWSHQSQNINDYEFRIFSQFGDDGIIQYLAKHIDIENQTFIEFGVGDYSESNTRFLLMNNNWSGFVMDSSSDNMQRLQNKPWYWKYDLRSKTAFITKENINELLAEASFSNIGLLHIDIDGVDYHIFNEIDLSTLNPSILIFEYNSLFALRPITVPYSKDFDRTSKHYSNLYWGASITAFEYLASKKGYALVASNMAGNNIYFIRKDLLNDKINMLSAEEVHKNSKFRDCKNENGILSLLSWAERSEAIKGLEVMNVTTGNMETI